jgi:hypothetical protein
MKTNLDHFIKKRLEGYQEKASKLLWYRLILRSFLHTVLGKMIVALVTISSIGIVVFFIISLFQKQSSSQEQKLNSNNTIVLQNTKQEKTYDKQDSNIVDSNSFTGNKKQLNKKSTSYSKDTSISVLHNPATQSPVKNIRRYPKKKMNTIGLSASLTQVSQNNTKPDNNENIISTFNQEANRTHFPNTITPIPAKEYKIHRTQTYFQTKRNAIKMKRGFFSSTNEISLYFMPSLNQTVFGKNAEYQDHIKIRENAEKVSNAYSSGLFLKHHFDDRHFVETGINLTYVLNDIQYHTVNKFYDEENSYYIYDTTWQIIGGYPPDSIAIIDSTFFPVYANKVFDADSKQEFQYFSIPLLFGWKMVKKNIKIELSLGATIGWLENKKGEILKFTNMETISLKESTKSILFQQMGRLRLGYQLDKDINLFVAPQYTFQLNTLNKSSYPIRFRFLNFGIGFGLAYKF